jgi:hypothetical protein
MNRKQFVMLCLAIVVALGMTMCATTQLPKDSTFAQKAEAVCSDLQASILGSQIGLAWAQQSNWAYDYGKAQQTLVEASKTLTLACAAARTEGDLVTVRDAVLQALAKAQMEQAQVKTWK